VRALRVIWASPYSLAGALLGLAFRSRRFAHGVLLCEGAEWPRRLGWRYRAITFGHVVLGIDELDEGTMAHELAHVRQYERWGPFFGPAYLLSSLLQLLRGRSPYRDNRFEREAFAKSGGANASCPRSARR
jgi:hypothetical protein